MNIAGLLLIAMSTAADGVGVPVPRDIVEAIQALVRYEYGRGGL